MDKVTEFKRMCRDLEETFNDSHMHYLLSLLGQINPQNYKKAALEFRKFTHKLTKQMKSFRKASINIGRELPKRQFNRKPKVAISAA